MLSLIIGAVAALVGVFAGLLLRSRELRANQTEIQRLQQESAARAGFEAFAAERAERIAQLVSDCDALRADLKAKTEESVEAARVIAKLTATIENERESVPKQLQALESAKGALSDHFRALAGDVLKNEKQVLSETNTAQLGALLDPLKDQIKDFRNRVEQAQTDSKVGVGELKTLIGTLGDLNRELSEEAHNLATALRRDTKMQGNWGETILRNILDKSGLQEGPHYSFQENFVETDADGEFVQRRQTDVIVNLPGGRHLIIDSKVSLNAYNDSVNAEDDEIRAGALKRHLLSIRNHFNELASRNYQKLSGVQSPDFVVMFVPIEPAFLLALQNDDSLWNDAYQKGILLSGPTTVLFVIRIVKDLWRQQDQADNVDKVMKRGAELYDKFVGFVNNLESVGISLGDARKAHEEAVRQLSTGPGNLIRQVEMLRKLAQVTPKGKKQIPMKYLESAEIDEPTLELAAEADEGD